MLCLELNIKELILLEMFGDILFEIGLKIELSMLTLFIVVFNGWLGVGVESINSIEGADGDVWLGVGVESINSIEGADGDVVLSGISFTLLVMLLANTLIIEECEFNLPLGVEYIASIGGADGDVGGWIASTLGEFPFNLALVMGVELVMSRGGADGDVGG